MEVAEQESVARMDRRRKIEIIQVMRGIAALGIVYFHTEYGPWKSANWGVDFFFILSGYFLMYSTERIGGGYWKKKLLKICPLYYAMTVIVAIGYMLLPQFFRSTVVNVETLVKSFLFLPCYAENDKIYPVYSIGWTLNLEMFFYLLFFVAMKMNHKQRGNIAMGMACLLIMARILFEPQSVMLKFWMQARLIDFIVGIGIYELEQKVGEVRIDKKICTGVILAMLIGLFSGQYLLGDWFTYLWNTCCGAVLLFFCLPLKGISVNQYLKGLGDISYAIYMTHFLIIGVACRVFIDNTVISFFHTVTVILAMAVVVGCSAIVYQIFEVKIRSCIDR